MLTPFNANNPYHWDRLAEVASSRLENNLLLIGNFAGFRQLPICTTVVDWDRTPVNQRMARVVEMRQRAFELRNPLFELTPQAKLDAWLKAKADRYARVEITSNGSGRDYYRVTIRDAATRLRAVSQSYDRDDAIATALIDFARFEEPDPEPATAQERLDAWLAEDGDRRSRITEILNAPGEGRTCTARLREGLRRWGPICRGQSKGEAIELALEKAKERGY